MESDSPTEVSTSDAIEHASTKHLTLTQQGRPGGRRPTEKSTVLADSVALLFDKSWRIYFVKPYGEIFELDALQQGEAESTNDDLPYQKFGPIEFEGGGGTVLTTRIRPRVAATVFRHETNYTDQLRIYYIDAGFTLCELCKGSDAKQQGKGYYKGSLDGKGWKVAPESPLTCASDGKFLKVFYSKANNEEEQKLYVAWARFSDGKWFTRAVT